MARTDKVTGDLFFGHGLFDMCCIAASDHCQNAWPSSAP
jgi:hypothetical protein